MGIRKRRIVANYLKIGDGFEFLGTGFTSLNEKPSAKTSSKKYISDASATQSITSYEWSSEFSADQIVNDKAIGYIRNIGEMGLTGGDAESEYIIVDTDVESNTSGGYRARMRKVAIQVDSFDDNDGELGVSGSFLGIGDVVEGTFDKETKKFTKGFTAKTTITK